MQRAVAMFGRPKDRILEVGAQLKEVSWNIVNRCSEAVLVDVDLYRSNNSGRTGPRDIQSFEELHHVTLLDLPSLDHWNAMIFQQSQSATNF